MWWLAAAKAVKGYFDAQSQADQQRLETEEAARRVRAEHDQTIGQGTAAAAASGVDVTSSSSLAGYLRAMTLQFRKQEAWAYDAGMVQADATKQAGWWNAVSDVGSGLTQYGQSTNWGKSPQLGGK